MPIGNHGAAGVTGWVAWPGERPLPPGADPIAERWGFSRGVDVVRLRAALQRRPDLLPAMP